MCVGIMGHVHNRGMHDDGVCFSGVCMMMVCYMSVCMMIVCYVQLYASIHAHNHKGQSCTCTCTHAHPPSSSYTNNTHPPLYPLADNAVHAVTPAEMPGALAVDSQYYSQAVYTVHAGHPLLVCVVLLYALMLHTGPFEGKVGVCGGGLDV